MRRLIRCVRWLLQGAKSEHLLLVHLLLVHLLLLLLPPSCHDTRSASAKTRSSENLVWPSGPQSGRGAAARTWHPLSPLPLLLLLLYYSGLALLPPTCEGEEEHKASGPGETDGSRRMKRVSELLLLRLLQTSHQKHQVSPEGARGQRSTSEKKGKRLLVTSEGGRGRREPSWLLPQLQRAPR